MIPSWNWTGNSHSHMVPGYCWAGAGPWRLPMALRWPAAICLSDIIISDQWCHIAHHLCRQGCQIWLDQSQVCVTVHCCMVPVSYRRTSHRVTTCIFSAATSSSDWLLLITCGIGPLLASAGRRQPSSGPMPHVIGVYKGFAVDRQLLQSLFTASTKLWKVSIKYLIENWRHFFCVKSKLTSQT